MRTDRYLTVVAFAFALYGTRVEAGTLNVTVHNVNDNTVTNARVHLYYGSGLDANTNPSGVATFSNVNSGTYSYEVYYTGTEWGQEYWGDDSALVGSGTTADSFTRNMPYRNGSVVFERWTGSSWVTIGQGATIDAGSQVRVKVPAQNPNSNDLQCSSRVRIDRNQAGADYTFNVDLTPIAHESPLTLTSTGQTLLLAGTYSFALEYLNTRLLNLTTLRTDATNWANAFTVRAGSLEVTVRNVNNSTVPDARVHLYYGNGRDDTTDDNGVAVFTDLTPGSYTYEVWYTGTPWGEEYWGDESATVQSGTNSDPFTRNMPYITGGILIERWSGSGWVTVALGATIDAGTQVRVSVPARNPNSNDLQCSCRVRLDRDQSGADYTFDVGLASAGHGSPLTLVSSGQNVSLSGTYSLAVEHLNTKLANQNIWRTDATNWVSGVFKIDPVVLPVTNGRIAFHSYSDYLREPAPSDTNDGHLFVYELGVRQLAKITSALSVVNAMNPHFSPDGSKLVFMAIPSAKANDIEYNQQEGYWQRKRSNLDIYLYELTDGGLLNLTENSGIADEDPKFSPDGALIVFKRQDQVWLMHRNGKNDRRLSWESAEQKSGPNFSPDGSQLVFWKNAVANADVWRMQSDGTGESPIVATSGLQEYYPVFRDANRVLYVRWDTTAIPHYDKVYQYTISDGTVQRLPFNANEMNDSDPFPIGATYVGFSSDGRPGGKDGWDVYIGDPTTGAVFAIPGANDNLHNLGGWYSEFNADEVQRDFLLDGRVTIAATEAGMPGVTLTFSGGLGGTTTDVGGYYAKTAHQGWSGTITPSKAGYVFTPAGRSYTNLSGDQSNQDYAASGAPQLSQGAIVAWGNNGFVQTNVPAPNAGFIGIAAGGAHSLGLKTDGSIVAWGDNRYGQCNIPVPNADFIGIAAGDYHSLGLKADGSIVTWGCGTYLPYGRDYGQCNVPSPNTGFVAVAAGLYHSLGLKTDGSIVALGCEFFNFGQCNVPAPNTGFVGVAAGWYHSLGFKVDGGVVGWGCGDFSDDYGQCDVPAHNSGFVAVAAVGGHSLGLKADGSIVAWGRNDYGQTNVPAPNADFIGIAAGGYHSLALKADGAVVAWGYNYDGQTDVPAPNTGFVGVAAGEQHSLGIRRVTGDADGDGDVDWADLAEFADNLLGPAVEPELVGWRFYDVDMDNDVDLRDLAVWQNAFTGS